MTTAWARIGIRGRFVVAAQREADAGCGRAAPVHGQSVHASVVHEIGFRIIRGDFPPGTILPNEAEWSESFGVSRSVIREAVKTLTAKNLIASRQKIGSWVEPREYWNLLDREVLAWYAAAPGNRAFLRTVQEFRTIMEPEAAALAAERRTDEEMEAISRACQEMGTRRPSPRATAADTPLPPRHPEGGRQRPPAAARRPWWIRP